MCEKKKNCKQNGEFSCHLKDAVNVDIKISDPKLNGVFDVMQQLRREVGEIKSELEEAIPFDLQMLDQRYVKTVISILFSYFLG